MHNSGSIAGHGHSRPGGRVHHEQAKEPTEFISTSASDAKSVAILNDIFRKAAREKVSDVHIEDNEGGCVIRFRNRGEMTVVAEHTIQESREFDSKIRMRCKLPLVERMTPLDGKFRFDVDGRHVDVRVSILPLGTGQSIVCRLLDQSNNLMRLDDLQMPEAIRESIRHVISQQQGLFLVTGPTGSGKTTTLYGILQQLNTTKVKIITIEDPIEFRVPGIVQAQTNQKLTFASALKSMLRQDPDVILVGEIRDSETAEIAIQSALTGHLVFSTLHTNDAASAVTRLIDMGVEPFLVSSSVNAIMAQRLVRKICPHCREAYVPSEAYLEQAGLSSEQFAGRELYRGTGCGHCLQTGYKGRIGIFELMSLTPEMKSLILTTSDAGQIKNQALASPETGMRTLRQDGLRKVLNGLTTLEEVFRVT